jgi:pimeloyl-ACP methyl ester carboxylesterase
MSDVPVVSLTATSTAYMFEVPETRYAKSGDVNIAYQVVGEGPFDLIHVPPFVSNLELQWEDPAERRYFERLASFCRLIMFDKRGTGLSDRVAVATLEERMDDLRAVMDAVGSQRAAVYGGSESGALSILFTTTYPERVSALVLYGAYPRMAWAPDYPDGWPEEIAAGLMQHIEEYWGRGQEAGFFSTCSHRTGSTIPPGAKHTAMGAPVGKSGRRCRDLSDGQPDRRAPPLVGDPGTDARGVSDGGLRARGGQPLPGFAHPRRQSR